MRKFRNRFTGERLHDGDLAFGVDLARHRAAYAFARRATHEGPILDVGSGSGYGTAALVSPNVTVVGLDRVPPDRQNRSPGVQFVRADIAALPLAGRSFPLVTSFQVIEHLTHPDPYLAAIAGLLRTDGTAIITTPNVLLSDHVNPYHVHEYHAEELVRQLAPHFGEVEMLGVGMTDEIRRYMATRSARIRRILRFDPLRLRERLPQSLVRRLFACGARVVRHQVARADGSPNATPGDFPIRALTDDAIDLLAVCRKPR